MPNRDENNRTGAFRSQPASQRMFDAIKTISSGASVSDSLLKEVLQLSENPNNLAAFCSQPGLAHSCIKLLGQHRKKSPIFQSEYGSLCIRVLVLSLQVGVLLEDDSLIAFLDKASQRNDSNFTLNNHVPLVLYNRLRLLEKCTDPRGAPPLFLVPWVSPPDAALLLDYFTQERDILLVARLGIAPNFWSGWSVLFYSMWANFRGGRIPNAATSGALLNDLVCRFVARELEIKNEELLFAFLSLNIKILLYQIDGQAALPGPTGHYDGIVVSKAYSDRLSGVNPPPMTLSLILFDWAVSSLDFSLPDMMATFFEASYLRLWRALDFAKEKPPMTFLEMNDLVEYTDRIFGYTAQFIEGAGPGGVSQAIKDSLATLLYENDMFSLLARVLSVRFSCDSHNLKHEENLSIGEVFDTLLETFEDIGKHLPKYCPSILEAFQSSFIDWLKAAQFFQERCHTLSQDPFIQAHISKCQPIWVKLGFSLLRSHLKDRPPSCCHPRCPYPSPLGGVQFICARCRVVNYCSYSCQHAHWLYHSPDASHSNECSNLTLSLVPH